MADSGAAFFDLDKTLIEGSSALHFARAAYKTGMLSRRQLARDAWANIRFRLRGSTDQGTEELKQRVLDAIAGQRVLELDGGIGMRSEIKDGVYTGRADGPFTYREGKAEAIRELAAGEGIDLAESYAYSDSESDLPMLRVVGHPVAVNPDAKLQRIAREEGWRIMRFDKLGRRIKLAGAAGGLALVAGGGGVVAAPPPPPRRVPRRPPPGGGPPRR